jgi:hypothetical protein
MPNPNNYPGASTTGAPWVMALKGDAPVATAIPLFSNAQITQNTTDAPRSILTELDWMSVNVNITAVTGTNPTATFRIQWSYDNAYWAEAQPQDVLGTATGPINVIERFQIKAPYWRLAVVVGGTNPVFTCTANALV